MGAILAKFRKEKTTREQLEKLETDIKEIEEYTISTQAAQKRYVGNFLVISIGFYVICFIVFYFAFFPPTWMERITYSVPLLIFPLLIFLLKRLVAWYFQRKLNKNSVKLNKFKNDKKIILEKVMDKETYKVALDILNRFGDKSNNYKPSGIVNPRVAITPQKPALDNANKQLTQSQNLTPRNPIGVADRQQMTSVMSLNDSFKKNTSSMHSPQIQRKRTPFPVINFQNQGVLQKMVDYLIGDGPQNRFAMICKNCCGHNGMALEEDYEYTSYVCIYCNTINPSRKSRPVAPKLQMAMNASPAILRTPINRKQSDSSTSPSEKYSGSESEDGSDSLQVKKIPTIEINQVEEIIENNNDIAVENITEVQEGNEEEIKDPTKPTEEKKND